MSCVITEEALMTLIEGQENQTIVRRWLDRGDGCAVYVNAAFDHSQFGHRKFVSFGSSAAQLETDVPPQRLPDIGNTINWPYVLESTVRRGGKEA